LVWCRWDSEEQVKFNIPLHCIFKLYPAAHGLYPAVVGNALLTGQTMKKLVLILTLVTVTAPVTFGQDVKKCDGTIVTFAKEKVGRLNKDDIGDFLLTFGKECENNVEFAEYSNEVLFLVLDKQTELTLRTIEKQKQQLDLNEILSTLSSPINDGIDVKSLIPKVEQVKFDGRLKKQVLDSLKIAVTRMSP
jgi:hypothetical protein